MEPGSVDNCQYGLVLRIPITAIPEVQRFIAEIDGRIIYQFVTAGKLWIMKGEPGDGVIQ